MIIKDVHDLRRFSVQNTTISDKEMLNYLKARYARLKDAVENVDRQLTSSKLRRHKLDGEWLSPYEELVDSKYAISVNLIKVAIGILSYGHLDMLESIIKYMPIPKESDNRVTHMFGFALAMLLPIPDNWDKWEYIRWHPEKLQAWYQIHKEKLVWDESQLKFILYDEQNDLSDREQP